ncbi:hypothetical protein QBC34DRAFT_379526 [Podospora aff. communis PSN243]|uniref:WD-like domain-containing protein n=1 Tax=Podospora aff. communis PSN243 TaxID=3040156 RepID=A0AAV9GPI6_9PEZI|nr:hypothetical protein QBC34DRAFT_379526 [Podospora aff. communis PSN243]
MKLSITLSTLLATLAFGTPTPSSSENMTELFARAEPECNSSHRAGNDDCRVLLLNLQSDTTGVQNSPRHIQYNGCYISWSKEVPAYTQRKHLYSAGNEVLIKCRDKHKAGEVSGLKRGAYVNGREMTVCISNRASGCS